MKTTTCNYTLFILGFILLVFPNAICNKDEEDRGFGNDKTGTLNWTINGTNYSGTIAAYAEKTTGGGSNPQPKIYVRGVQSSGDLQFDIQPASAIGTYIAGGKNFSFNSISATAGGQNYYAHNNNVLNDSVFIYVTELNSTKVKGNFSGRMKSNTAPSAAITGNFDLNFR